MLPTITLIGNLGKDAVTRKVETKNGPQTVVSFSAAVNGVDRDGKETKTWYNISAWNALGTRVVEHLIKGKQVMIIGAFNPRDYVTNDGRKGTSYDVTAHVLQLLGGPRQEVPAAEGENVVAGVENLSDIPF